MNSESPQCQYPLGGLPARPGGGQGLRGSGSLAVTLCHGGPARDSDAGPGHCQAGQTRNAGRDDSPSTGTGPPGRALSHWTHWQYGLAPCLEGPGRPGPGRPRPGSRTMLSCVQESVQVPDSCVAPSKLVGPARVVSGPGRIEATVAGNDCQVQRRSNVLRYIYRRAVKMGYQTFRLDEESTCLTPARIPRASSGPSIRQNPSTSRNGHGVICFGR
jgi:hypothetical protein